MRKTGQTWSNKRQLRDKIALFIGLINYSFSLIMPIEGNFEFSLLATSCKKIQRNLDSTTVEIEYFSSVGMTSIFAMATILYLPTDEDLFVTGMND